MTAYKTWLSFLWSVHIPLGILVYFWVLFPEEQMVWYYFASLLAMSAAATLAVAVKYLNIPLLSLTIVGFGTIYSFIHFFYVSGLVDDYFLVAYAFIVTAVRYWLIFPNEDDHIVGAKQSILYEFLLLVSAVMIWMVAYDFGPALVITPVLLITYYALGEILQSAASLFSGLQVITDNQRSLILWFPVVVIMITSVPLFYLWAEWQMYS